MTAAADVQIEDRSPFAVGDCERCKRNGMLVLITISKVVEQGWMKIKYTVEQVAICTRCEARWNDFRDLKRGNSGA